MAPEETIAAPQTGVDAAFVATEEKCITIVESCGVLQYTPYKLTIPYCQDILYQECQQIDRRLQDFVLDEL